MASPVTDAKLKHIADGFTEVVERGKGSLKSRKPGTNQYALTSQVGNYGWHRGNSPFTELDEIDTDWQPTTGTWDYEMTQADYQAYIDTAGNYRYEDYLTGEYVNLNVTFFGWTNDEGASQQIPFNQVTPSVSGDLLTWAELFGTGTELRIQTQIARLAKYVDVDSLANLPAPTIGGTNIRLTFSYQMIRSSDLDVYVDGAKWNDNSTVTTATDVEFRQKTTGNPIWWFIVPIAWDANDSQVTGSQTLKKAGANLFVDGHIPYSWIASAAFPITIDPTIDPNPAASADDGNQSSSGTITYNATSDYLSRDAGWYYFCRFPVTVANGSTATTSYFSGYFYNNASDIVDITLYGEDTQTPAALTGTSYEISDKTQTTANSGTWSESGLAVPAAYHNSPSLVSVINELFGSYDYSSGDYIGIISVTNQDTTENGLIRSYDNGSSMPILHIEYTTGATTLESSVSDNVTVGEAAAVGPLLLTGVGVSNDLTVGEAAAVGPLLLEIDVDV